MTVLKIISKIFFPEKCPLCGRTISVDQKSCPHCRDDRIQISDNFCHHCGHETERCICGISEVSLSHIGALGINSGITKAEIYEFKFNNKKDIGKDLAHKMSLRVAAAFPEAEFDCVTFVPMTKKAKRERGFNQSEFLAKNIAKSLFIPCEALLTKSRETAKQHTVSAAQRATNLSDAFALAEGKDVKEKTILLCDDIKTTGNTLKECEDVLLKNGAKDVYCICVALSDYGDIFPPLDKTKETN